MNSSRSEISNVSDASLEHRVVAMSESRTTLQIGNSQSIAWDIGRARAHFGLWALMKAPLLIGADLRKVESSDLATLKAEEVIAVNQDKMGVAGDLIYTHGDIQVLIAQQSTYLAIMACKAEYMKFESVKWCREIHCNCRLIISRCQ
jgi:hypothetical protein